ncbi:MAG TPA: transaldolase, partial [Vicinamibacteria bacterium]|nr:transaldolase [Vicinamibacteria bacterium]
MPNPRPFTLPADLEAAVSSTLREWTQEGRIARLWDRDATLWTGGDEARWLGWLGVVDEQLRRLDALERVADDVRRAGFTHTVLLGMGGSSLSPEVLRMTFGRLPGWPDLSVLDSTDPAQVRACEARVDLGRTLFVVSSKSGTTLEPNIFKQHFFERVQGAVGPDRAADRFIAITDPGSELERTAKADGFRHVLFGLPSIGGRYSALSDFGMAPAALMGLDVARLLGGARAMARACAAQASAEENPGAALGVTLGVLAGRGRDKVTLVASPGIHDLGAWLEQLLAESTGKAGKGLIPVDREAL